MDGERKEGPKEALGAGDSTKSSEISGARSSSSAKPAVAIPEAESDVKMQPSDVKEIKSTDSHTETAIKESETGLQVSKTVTESPKTEVTGSENSVSKLEIPLKENNNTAVKKSHTTVIALKELAQKAASSVKDTETAIKEPKEVESSGSEVKSETPISTTENPETDVVSKFETNVKKSIVSTNGTKDSIKETETEIKDCGKKDSDSVAGKSAQEVKELEKKHKTEVKQADPRTEDIRIASEPAVSEVKSSKGSELMDMSLESENDDQKKNEMAMETDTAEGSSNTVKESKNETKPPTNGTSCSEAKVQDSSHVAEDSEMECDLDSSSATIMISDADMSVDKSDVAAEDTLLTKEKQPVSQGESDGQTEKQHSEIKDCESSRTSTPAVEADEPMIVEPVSETSDKVKEMQASVEKLKISTEAPKKESEKAEESQKLSLQSEDNLNAKESKREKTEEALNESVKTETQDLVQHSKTDAMQTQSKISKKDKDESTPDTGKAAPLNIRPASEEQKELASEKLVKQVSGKTVSLDASAVSGEEKNLAKVEHIKPDRGASASRSAAASEEKLKLSKVEHINPNSGDLAPSSASAVSEEKKLAEVEPVKPDSGNTASKIASTVSEEKKNLATQERKPGSCDAASRNALAVSQEKEKLATVKPVKPDNSDTTKAASAVLEEKKTLTTAESVKADSIDTVAKAASAVPEQKKSIKVESVKSASGDTASKNISTASEEQKKLAKMEAAKVDSSDAASRNASAVSEEQKKLPEVETGKPNKNVQPSSAVSEVPKTMAEVENIKSQNAKTMLTNVQNTETGEKLAGPELIKPGRDEAVAMDVDPASSVSEKSNKFAKVEALAKPEDNKTMPSDVQLTLPGSEKVEKLPESGLVKPDNTAIMHVQSGSAVAEEAKNLTETECEKPESSKTMTKDIQHTAASSGEQKKLGKPEEAKEMTEVKPENTSAMNVDVQNTESDREPKHLTKGEAVKQASVRPATMDVQNTAGEAEKPRKEAEKLEDATPVTTDVQHTVSDLKEPKKLTKAEAGKPEDVSPVTLDVQHTASDSEETKKLTKVEAGKVEDVGEGDTEELKKLEPVNPKGATPVTVDIQNDEDAAEEPTKVTKELEKMPSSDMVAVSKEQKQFSESELMKPSAVEDAPKEKSETDELKSVKAAEEEEITEKLAGTEKAVTAEVSKVDTDMSETISKAAKDEKQQKEEEIVVLNIDDDDDEERTPDAIEIQEEPTKKEKTKESTNDAEESGSDDTYCSRASSATPELNVTQESECDVSGTNAGSEPDIFASESQAEDLDDTATPPYKEFVAASQNKERAIKSSTTLGTESQGNEDNQRTSVKRKHDTSDSSDAPESSLPPRKEPRVAICDTEEEEEEKMEDDDIVPATAPEPKPVDVVQKSGNVPKLTKSAISATEDVLELKEVQISPKADRKRPAEETLSPKIQRKLTFEEEPHKEPISVRKKLKLNTDGSENHEVNESSEVEVLEAKNSRKSIEVLYMKSSLQRSSTPNEQKERLEKVEESKNMETEEGGGEEKDELSTSQDLILRLSPSPSQVSQISNSVKAQMSPSLSNSTHKSETESHEETPEVLAQKENSKVHMETIVEVEEPKALSIQQNGDSCTVIDIEKEEKVKLSEKLKRKREDAPVIDVHGSDSECENTQTPDEKKRKTTENGHKDTPSLPLPVHLLKEKGKKHSTPTEGAYSVVETSASSIELEHEKDTHPETSYNEETVTYLKKVTQEVLLKVEVSKHGSKVLYLGVEQCKIIAEDDYQHIPTGVSDLSSGNLADTSTTGSPSSVVSVPGPYALPNNRFSIMTTSSSSSGASSTALGASRGRSASDIGSFTAPLGRIPRTGKDSFQNDIGVSANRRIEHMDVIEDVLMSVVDAESDMEKRSKSSRIAETCSIKEDVKEVAKKSFCDAFTTMNTSPAQMEEDKVRDKEEQVEEGAPPSQETPKVTKKRFASRMRSVTKARSVSSKSRGSADEPVSAVRERRKSKEQEKQETEKSVQEAGKRSTRVGSTSSHSEDAQGTKSNEAPQKRSTRKQSSEVQENTDDSKAASDVAKRSTRNRSDSNVSSSESKEKSTPTPTAKRSSRKRSSSDTPETKDDSREPKAKQMAVSVPKRSSRKRSDSSFTESAEEAKSRTPSGKSSLEMQDNTSSKAATPFTPKSERKKEKEAAVPQTPEHASVYTLKEMKPGLAVFAKWTDRKYYSAKLKELQTDGRWVVEFDDGKSKPLLEDYIVAVDQLSKGQLVYAMNEEEEYLHGVIKNVEKKGRKESYTVELDEGETVTVTRKELFMTEDQAKILRENIASTPVKTTPHRLTELTLDNVLEGKRSRSKKNLDSPSQIASTSGLSKKGKPPSSASSEVESASGVEYVDGVQRESAGHVVSRRIKGKGTGDPKKNVDDYGAMPKEGSTIFKGKCFLLTSTDAPVIHPTTELDDSIHNTTTATEDDDSAAAGDYQSVRIPFSKAHLTQQIRAGGGTVYNKFEDIPPAEYKNCFLISNRPNLTAKYILCLVHNIPLVSHGWIFISCQSNKLANFADYELPAGWSVLENKYVSVKKKRRSLNNMKIGLVSESKYFVKFWETVLKAAGASVLRIPPEGVNKPMKLQVIISNSSCPFEVQKRAKDLAIPLVSTMWIVQCLINGTRVPFDHHPQFNYDHSFSD